MYIAQKDFIFLWKTYRIRTMTFTIFVHSILRRYQRIQNYKYLTKHIIRISIQNRFIKKLLFYKFVIFFWSIIQSLCSISVLLYTSEKHTWFLLKLQRYRFDPFCKKKVVKKDHLHYTLFTLICVVMSVHISVIGSRCSICTRPWLWLSG